MSATEVARETVLRAYAADPGPGLEKTADVRDAGNRKKEQPTPPGTVRLDSACDTSPKRAPGKKPEAKSENRARYEKAAWTIEQLAKKGGFRPTEEELEKIRAVLKRRLMAKLLPETVLPEIPIISPVGQHVLTGLGNVFGAIGLPGVREKFQEWGTRPGGRAIAGTLSAIATALAARRLLTRRKAALGGAPAAAYGGPGGVSREAE